MPTFYNSKNNHKWNSRNREPRRDERNPDSGETDTSPEIGRQQEDHHTYVSDYDDSDGHDRNYDRRWRARPRQRYQRRTTQRNPSQNRWNNPRQCTSENTSTDTTTDISAIVTAVLEQLGHRDTKRHRRLVPSPATRQSTPTRSHSRGPSSTRSG